MQENAGEGGAELRLTRQNNEKATYSGAREACIKTALHQESFGS